MYGERKGEFLDLWTTYQDPYETPAPQDLEAEHKDRWMSRSGDVTLTPPSTHSSLHLSSIVPSPEHPFPIAGLFSLFPATSISTTCTAHISFLPQFLLVLREFHIPASQLPSPLCLSFLICAKGNLTRVLKGVTELYSQVREEMSPVHHGLTLRDNHTLRVLHIPRASFLVTCLGCDSRAFSTFAFKMAARGPGANQATGGGANRSNSSCEDQGQGHTAQGIQPDCPEAPCHYNA